ncbi:hypothetical protein B7P43_G02850 [Cryptotermes secundus]|uniref:Uncharacterized protein n=1 Tax=Cryptotermes secundus TaxID=105785 RepID=A0A2J7QU49_9NEOP|nr:hypothetical protein B7P43_G02850 [Cryptotermes secundus]
MELKFKISFVYVIELWLTMLSFTATCLQSGKEMEFKFKVGFLCAIELWMPMLSFAAQEFLLLHCHGS